MPKFKDLSIHSELILCYIIIILYYIRYRLQNEDIAEDVLIFKGKPYSTIKFQTLYGIERDPIKLVFTQIKRSP